MNEFQLVRVRGARWRVSDVVPYDDCTLLTLAGAEPGGATEIRHVLTPFDDVDLLMRGERGRRVRLRRWRRACRALLATVQPAGRLRCAGAARMDLLPHQLVPALAVLQGRGSRVLLADDVGLGKTIQAGLILGELVARKCVERALVLAPAGVRDQWVDELSVRFAIHAARADAWTLRQLASTLPIGVNPWTTNPVVVSSIDYAKRAEVLPAVAACRWDLLIVDEAHIVGGDSDRRQAVERLASRASFVVLVSATPHSGDEAAFEKLCAIGTAHGIHDDLLVFRRTRQSVRPHSVRRVRIVRVRPSQAEVKMFVALARYERAVRDEHGRRALALSVLDKRAFSSPWALAESVDRRLAALGDSQGGAGRQLFLPLDDQQGELCLEDAPPPWPPDLALADADRERGLLTAVAATARQAAQAGESKVTALARLLRRIREPALIFTEFRDTAAHVQTALGRGQLMHGSLPRHERIQRLDAFAAGSCALLVATDAAAQGLNLQRACRLVVNLELPWNPMRLEQRIGRVDRIGQRRRVHAIHLVGRGTGEGRILERLQQRVKRARTAIAAPDPLDIGTSYADATAVTTSCPDLSPAAVVEASRLEVCRSLWRPDDHCALSALEATPWWIGRARRSRPALSGRAIFIFRVSARNGLGTSAASDIVALTTDRTTARTGAIPAIPETLVNDWFATLIRIERDFHVRLLARERSILYAVRDEGANTESFQPTLFDRRAERAAAEAAADRRDLRSLLGRRLVQAERLGNLHSPSAQLLLVLLP